ncbi:MAG TPA: CHC2 zinc finger domain-containing protein [Anaerolineaceae bacterium]|nr:CHC2 zinc finger domain-containing protein [Anaerolineaceae bacterium]
MGVIDDIKASIDIVALIGETVKLERKGKTYHGLCPFHAEKTPSFTVWTEGKNGPSWHCFGCHAGGDVIDFVQKLQNLDTKEAVRRLAERAGIQLRPQTKEEVAAQEKLRTHEAILGAAMSYFRAALWREGEPSSAGLTYALSRGFTRETIQDAGLGFFGKDWNGLREALKLAGVDLTHPTAVALVGYKGDVATWAKTWGITAPQAWVEAGKVPAMPPDMLIYPHLWRGRARYASGRGLPEPEAEGDTDEQKKRKAKRHYNLDETLVGSRQPYVNTAYRTSDNQVVIVEGQADAITLGQWQIGALALAGTALSFDDQSSADNVILSVLKPLAELAKKGEEVRIYLALDDDKAGRESVAKAAAVLMDMGFSGADIRMVQWPAKDANAWLMAEGTAEKAAEMLRAARAWIVVMAEMAARSNEESQVKGVFATLARMDAFEVERARESVALALGMRRKTFDALLRQARREAGMDDDSDSLYYIENGRVYARSFDQVGNETSQPLCNFAAQISADIMRDDGQNQMREFHIKGQIGKRHMPSAIVPADEYGDMAWVVKHWGSRAIIEAGSRKKDQLRAAIQHLSVDVERKIIFTHTGWRDVGDRRVFLSNAGAIGGEGITVELDTDFEMYEVPLEPVNLNEAIRASLSFLDIAPDRVTFPLWGSIWLAPMSDLIHVAFTLWVYGGTGAMKSTLSALALNHFGARWDDKHMPAGFLDTANRLEQKTFIAKNVILIIDDFAPQKNSRDQQEYIRTAARVVRNVGNLAGRGRMAADTTARRTYYPRGLVIITGEDVPQSEGVMGRLFVVEMNRGDVNIERLSALQGRRAELPNAMSGYVQWAMSNWNTLKTTVPEQWRTYRQEMAVMKSHLRLPEALAGLMIGIDLGLRFALSQGVINGEQYQALVARGKAALLESGRQMAERVQDEKPEVMFVHAIADLLIQGKIYLAAVDPSVLNAQPIGGPTATAELIGWYDKDWYYLMPDPSYARVCQAFRDRGTTFPVSPATLRKMMREAVMLRTDTDDGRNTIVLWVNNSSRRVLAVKRTAFEESAAK